MKQLLLCSSSISAEELRRERNKSEVFAGRFQMKRRYVIRDEEHEGGKCMSSLRTKGLGKSIEYQSYVFAWRITYAVVVV